MEELFKREFGEDEDDGEYIPDKKELEEAEEEQHKKKKKKIINKSKVDEFWEKMKKNAGINKSNGNNNDNTKIHSSQVKSDKKGELSKEEEDKKLEDEIQKAILKAQEQKEKKIAKVFYFAGQKYEEEKEINEKELEKLKKNETHKGLDSIINEITKKKNITTIDKSKIDWKNYVKENNLEKELDKNRKDGFLGKKRFLDNANEIINEQQKLMVKKAKYAIELKEKEEKLK